MLKNFKKVVRKSDPYTIQSTMTPDLAAQAANEAKQKAVAYAKAVAVNPVEALIQPNAVAKPMDEKTKTWLDSILNPDDSLGVKFFGVNGWNKIKGAVAGYVDSLLNKPRILKKRQSVYNDFYSKLLRPNVSYGAELLGGGWFDNLSDFIGSKTFNAASGIAHNVFNLFEDNPYAGTFIKGGRKITNVATDVLNAMGFGSKVNDTVKTAAVGGGTLLLIGGGIAIWYFGFHKKKKRGRR